MVNSRLWETACETTVLKFETKTKKFDTPGCKIKCKRDFDQRRARYFKIRPKFSGIHIFRETILDDYLCALASDA